jgi:hypothetical protein
VVFTQTSDQRVATRVVSRAEITDRGRGMESIVKIAREKRREKRYSTQDDKHEPKSYIIGR